MVCICVLSLFTSGYSLVHVMELARLLKILYMPILNFYTMSGSVYHSLGYFVYLKLALGIKTVVVIIYTIIVIYELADYLHQL